MIHFRHGQRVRRIQYAGRKNERVQRGIWIRKVETDHGGQEGRCFVQFDGNKVRVVVEQDELQHEEA